MRCSLILSVALTIVIANPTIRRSIQAEKDSSLVNADIDIGTSEGSVSENSQKSPVDIPLKDLKGLTDLELKDKVSPVFKFVEKDRHLPKKLNYRKVLALIKKRKLDKAANIKGDEKLINIIDELVKDKEDIYDEQVVVEAKV